MDRCGSLCVGGWSVGKRRSGKWDGLAWTLPLEHSFLPPLLPNSVHRGRLSGSAGASFCCHYLFGVFSGTLERDFVYIYSFAVCVGLQL